MIETDGQGDNRDAGIQDDVCILGPARQAGAVQCSVGRRRGWEPYPTSPLWSNNMSRTQQILNDNLRRLTQLLIPVFDSKTWS